MFSKRRGPKVGPPPESEASRPRFSAEERVRLVRSARGLRVGAEGRIMNFSAGSRTVLVRFEAKLVQVRPDDIEPLTVG
jgi:hypothetical protein